MKKIEVEIEGTSPLLMNSPQAMLEPEKAIKSKRDKYNPKDEAEKVAYRTNKGKLYVPTTAIKASMLNGASFKKSGKYSLKQFIAGSTRIVSKEGNGEVILEPQKYEIDLRTVVIQRARVVKARPRLDEWKINFIIEFNDSLITPDAIKPSLEDAGQRIGLLDFRPQKGGEFGTFKINKWKVC